jgi:hypothetical protein
LNSQINQNKKLLIKESRRKIKKRKVFKNILDHIKTLKKKKINSILIKYYFLRKNNLAKKILKINNQKLMANNNQSKKPKINKQNYQIT